jgi:hypothetical protein
MALSIAFIYYLLAFNMKHSMSGFLSILPQILDLFLVLGRVMSLVLLFLQSTTPTLHQLVSETMFNFYDVKGTRKGRPFCRDC